MTENGPKNAIFGPPVHMVKVAEKLTSPANRRRNANAKNGLTLDPSPTMADLRLLMVTGRFPRFSFYPFLKRLEFYPKNGYSILF